MAPCSPAPEIAGKLSPRNPRPASRNASSLPPPTSRSRCHVGPCPQESAGTGRPPPHPADARCGRPAARPRSCMPWATGRIGTRHHDRPCVARASVRTRPGCPQYPPGPACREPGQGRCKRLAAGHRHGVAEPLRVASGSLAGSMNNSVPPSACVRAKPRANGVNGTSPPRMFSSQASRQDR